MYNYTDRVVELELLSYNGGVQWNFFIQKLEGQAEHFHKKKLKLYFFVHSGGDLFQVLNLACRQSSIPGG